jgi:hypothetical protein
MSFQNDQKKMTANVYGNSFWALKKLKRKILFAASFNSLPHLSLLLGGQIVVFCGGIFTAN